jgi:NADH-quinone oxidoreductase subunit N
VTPDAIRAMLSDPGLALALAPLAALGLGALALLLACVLPVPRWVGGGILLGSLTAAFVFEIAILRTETPPGLVLDGTYLADRTSALWGVLFLAATALAWLFSVHYYREDRAFKGEHDFLMLCATAGMLLMAGAQDLIVFFVGLELLSIPLYALAAFRRARTASVEAGVKYFLLGAFSAAFFLYGAALLYTATGTVSLVELRQIGVQTTLGTAGVALIAASLFFKVSVFPFHLWVPDVYQGSPTPVTALMATGTKTAAFAFLLNAVFLLPASAAATIAAVALLTMAAGNLAALVQGDVKRMLAFSAVAHAGTLLLVFAGALKGDPDPGGPLQAALFYLAAYVFTAAGSFGLLAYLERDGEPSTSLESLRGLARRRPWAAAALTLFLLSLGGIPATGGFLGKYLVFYVAIRAHLVAVAVIGILLSVVALAYYLRVVVAMYMQEATAETVASTPPSGRQSAAPAAIAATACAVLVLAMGLLPGWFLDQLR